MKAAENHVLVFFIALLLCFPLGAQNQFFPPNWFLDTEHKELHLLVYNPDGFGSTPKVALDQDLDFRWSFVNPERPNENYLSIDLDLSQLKGDQIEIEINGVGHKYKFEAAHKHQPQVLNPSDAIYLITADRFVNGDAKNDSLPGMNEAKYGREHDFGRHGGDIQGIIDRLDYIQEMGFTATWASPLLTNDEFKESYHGYAITDHYEIDPRLGDLDLYAEYVDKSHKRGMKVIMDVVYNHVGSQHLFHLNPPDSSFFHFDMMHTRSNFRAVNVMDPHVSEADKKQFTDGWFDNHMPDVNQRQEHFSEFLIQNSIWWILKFGIDAFRIDTYAYPDQAFMAKLAHRIKKERPDFFLFGEIWVHHPEIQSYFIGGNPYNSNDSKLDAVTDFQFRYALKESLERTQSWNEGIAKLYYRLAADYLYDKPENLVTFIDNHDEPRIFGEFHGDLRRLKAALGVLYTMRGIPCTYYGTEILMKETKHHGVIRQDFPGGFEGDTLNKFDPEVLEGEEAEINRYMRKLLAWRAESEAIANGTFLHFVPQYDVYVYFRISEGETVMVVLNTHPDQNRTVDLNRFREAWTVNGGGTDVITGEEAPVDQLEMAPMSVRIFSRKR